MADVEEEINKDVLKMKYISYSSVDNILDITNNLRKEIDIYYPKLTPAQRIGHEFCRDVQSIVGYLKATQAKREQMMEEQATKDSSWTRWFPINTPLGMTPFRVQDIIDSRRAQIEEMNAELHKLRRRIQRLRCEPVKLYPDELEEREL
ncbi:Conserved_hypothetical protein [Hexamita inflata]|uniref:Uncharacterized protein n=1 Tax=Hexamita inflata TaxID=28002 RepID=A0AA86UGY4_9EUKA|nr:Conserved hypothetical protein [Hexamita inflata]